MEHKIKVTIGDYVPFSYRKNPNLQLTGYVLSVLQNPIVVDITEIMGIEVDDVRQVGLTIMPINLRYFVTPKYKKTLFFLIKLD
ncbi:hypothetical protein P4310_29970 [Bacillus thuringiensis]|uniref:hypothetical protein n=1 Tax=Bacillus thuringiensis TaxID=1428 RepID=UPI0020CEF0ED|nr:hypothetical protein [Bacillus thuringiensis]MDY8164744.1 hypothetical protein [Bacillus thuringiensis]MED3069637.1 hypothetical protein [Bacillus thuringiensis]